MNAPQTDALIARHSAATAALPPEVGLDDLRRHAAGQIAELIEHTHCLECDRDALRLQVKVLREALAEGVLLAGRCQVRAEDASNWMAWAAQVNGILSRNLP